MIRRALIRLFRLFLPLLRLFVPRLGLLPSVSLPSAPPRIPKVELGCELAEAFTPLPGGLRDLQLRAADDTGLFQGETVTVVEPISVVGRFIVLANRDIVIRESVRRKPDTDVNQDVVLVSFNGTVRVDAAATVGDGRAARGSGTPPAALSSGRPGNPGSLTLLRGISVEIEGTVQGERGGEGEAIQTSNNQPQGRAYAFGGAGGAGGDVVICAVEGVRIGPIGRLRGGSGGDGGRGDAQAAHGGEAVGGGGPAHHGGDVVIRGLPPDAVCQVVMEPGAEIHAGDGGYGFIGQALRNFAIPPGRAPGGNGSANGGEGGDGGSVRFENCKVARVAFVESGHGGNGGTAYARGGEGGSASDGLSGGDAVARGGKAGVSGPEPRIPRTDDTVERGQRGRGGSGREAQATSGAGGNAGDQRGQGGRSGSASAKGGTSGGNAEAQEDRVPPAPPQGTQGGQGRDAKSQGAR
jgi:hypothetical protein